MVRFDPAVRFDSAVNFDAAERGTGSDEWAQLGQSSALAPVQLSGVDQLIVVAAHPDDETLGAGGLMTRLWGDGVRVELIVVTDGSASHPNSPTHPAECIAALREAETSRALSILAPGAGITFLRVPDGKIRENRSLVAALLGKIVPERTGMMLVAPWRGDGHRDHREVGLLCATVAAQKSTRLMEYPVWMWHWGNPAHPSVPLNNLVALQLTAQQRELKRRAIGEHRSQVAGLSTVRGDEPTLRANFLQHFYRDQEVFVTEPGRVL